MTSLPWLDPDQLWFPPAEEALEDPDGLLALGGDLSPERLILAYRNGISPGSVTTSLYSGGHRIPGAFCFRPTSTSPGVCAGH